MTDSVSDDHLAPDDLCFAFRAGEMLVRVDAGEVSVPRFDEAEIDHVLGPPLVAGTLSEHRSVAVALPADYVPPAGMEFRRLRALHGQLPADVHAMAGRASQILEWDAAHRFCGRCGGATERGGEPLARRCTNCGALHYPRLSPAILVRVVRDGRILLSRSPHFAPGVYSVTAGFVDPGESLEETCVREVREEVGIEIANVRYFASQPWPYPSSLMVAFTAEYVRGEIQIDGLEIEDAGWYGPDELPLVSQPLSLARALIDDFVLSSGADPATLRTA